MLDPICYFPKPCVQCAEVHVTVVNMVSALRAIQFKCPLAQAGTTAISPLLASKLEHRLDFSGWATIYSSSFVIQLWLRRHSEPNCSAVEFRVSNISWNWCSYCTNSRSYSLGPRVGWLWLTPQPDQHLEPKKDTVKQTRSVLKLIIFVKAVVPPPYQCGLKSEVG
jgi:hypothetical protein